MVGRGVQMREDVGVSQPAVTDRKGPYLRPPQRQAKEEVTGWVWDASVLFHSGGPSGAQIQVRRAGSGSAIHIQPEEMPRGLSPGTR